MGSRTLGPVEVGWGGARGATHGAPFHPGGVRVPECDVEQLGLEVGDPGGLDPDSHHPREEHPKRNAPVEREDPLPLVLGIVGDQDLVLMSLAASDRKVRCRSRN